MGKRKRPAFRLNNTLPDEKITSKEMLGLSLDIVYEKYPNMQSHALKSRMLDAIQIVIGKHLEESLGSILDRVNEHIVTNNDDLEKVKRKVEMEIMLASSLTSKSKNNLSYEEITMMRQINMFE